MSDLPRVQRDALRDLLAEAQGEAAKAEATLDPLPCGTRTKYTRGCHCLACRRAEADYQRRLYRTRATGRPPLRQSVPAGLLARRLDALKREGFSVEAIARQARLHPTTLWGQHSRVSVRTYLAVAAIYRRHCGEA